MDKYPVVIQPTNLNYHVPPQFQTQVWLHIVRNYVAFVNSPLYLAIQGPKGEGKTFQTIECCTRMNIGVIPISASILSGKHEGDAVNELKELYLYASAVHRSSKKLIVILIDDFHLSIASIFQNTERTINSQLLTGFMMNLHENPKRCCGEKAERIPIILTGNNFENLYSPLIRHGRMNIVNWQPDLQTKTLVIGQILNKYLLPEQMHRVGELVKEHQSQPISFFSELQNDLIDLYIATYLNEHQSIDLRQINILLAQSINRNIPIEKFFTLADKRKNQLSKNYEPSTFF